ncbi:MAG: hypothetical protein J2P28_24180 [Actinobacteria bacterium]|nr:hypothetical protein [Actinomycetota bacterium]
MTRYTGDFAQSDCSQIITTLDSSRAKDLGSPAVTYAEQIAQRLRAAQ